MVLATLAGLVLVLSACEQLTGQQPTNSPDITPSTAAGGPTPSTAPTPAETPPPAATPSSRPAKLIITSVTFHMGEVGLTYGTVTAGAAGGVKPYKWSISSGVLPPGLALSSGGGKTTGKPTVAGTFSFVIRVDDSAGGAAGVPRSIYVFRQLSFNITTAKCGNRSNKGPDNCSSVPSPALQIPYSGGTTGVKPTIKITGVTGGFLGKPAILRAGCFAVATNSPPPGMTVSASGGVMTLSAGPPDQLNWCGYRATITFVLVNPSPCGSGFLCTSSNTLSVLFNL